MLVHCANRQWRSSKMMSRQSKRLAAEEHDEPAYSFYNAHLDVPHLTATHHALHLILWQCGGACNLDVLLLATALVSGCHTQDAIGINVKLDLNLQQTNTGMG